YDSYVSGVSYHDEDRDQLARKLLEIHPLGELQQMFGDRAMKADVQDVLRHFPTKGSYNGTVSMSGFYFGARTPIDADGGRYEVNQSSLWREAHLALHEEFWHDVRHDLETVVGPVFLVSGDAYNERAGFEAG